MEKLTAQEETAMRLIWEIGPCVVRMLQEKYPEPRPPYTTLASVVKNLERKGYVKNRRCGNVYEYYPLISREEYRTAFMKDAVSYFRIPIRNWSLSLRKKKRFLRMICGILSRKSK